MYEHWNLEAKATLSWYTHYKKDYYFVFVGCGSFSGFFVEYLAHDMSKFSFLTFINIVPPCIRLPQNWNGSTVAVQLDPDYAVYLWSTLGYPVRKKYPQAASERLTIVSDSFMEDQCDDSNEESFSEQQEEARSSSKRLLPDRTHAAHNRANEKLVHFIVKQRMVEGHLLVWLDRLFYGTPGLKHVFSLHILQLHVGNVSSEWCKLKYNHGTYSCCCLSWLDHCLCCI